MMLRTVPPSLQRAVRRTGVRPTRRLLLVSVARQRMSLLERDNGVPLMGRFPAYVWRNLFRISTSRFGVGQVLNSKQTPLGLHRIARKIGGGDPVGTIFRARQPVGLVWQGDLGADATILHRILWLEGLEPGWNRGGDVDTFRRYIYLHGYGDELTLGRPQSCGCIHVAATELIRLHDLLPVGTLVWVE